MWGMVRPRRGPQPFRLQAFRAGAWRWVGSTRITNARGIFNVAIRAGHGSKVRVWSPRDGTYGPVYTVR
jgi:hypothetical protein